MSATKHLDSRLRWARLMLAAWSGFAIPLLILEFFMPTLVARHVPLHWFVLPFFLIIPATRDSSRSLPSSAAKGSE